MKSSLPETPIKLFELQNLETSIPAFPAAEICQHIGFKLSSLEKDLDQLGFHRLIANGRRYLSFYQASFLAQQIPSLPHREAHLKQISQSYLFHLSTTQKSLL